MIPITPRKRPNDYVSPEDPDSQGIVDRALELLEHYQSDLDGKLDDADGSVKENNIADESITVEIFSNVRPQAITTKEAKPITNTTLTGNENSDEFYPTTS